MDSIVFQKQVPVAYDVDVLVVGSGMAGIAAAMAVAGQGRSVLLVERFGVLGGNATTGGVANFCGHTLGQGKAFDEILSALDAFHALAPINPEKDGRIFNHELLAVILPELLARQGIRFVLHTEFVDVVVRDGCIQHALVSGPSGLQAVRAKQYIDCSGDGFLGIRAGASFMKGNEEGHQLPMSLMYFVRHVLPEEQRCEVPEGWFERIDSADNLPMTSLWPNGPHSSAYKIKVPLYDSTDTDAMTMAELNGRRKMMAVLDYHQRVENKPFILDHCSARIGLREGVRLTGEYVLTLEDVYEGRTFDDVIAVGTFYLDGHKPDDDKRTYILPKEWLGVPPYGIPVRSLLVKGLENLLCAGRCFSAEQLALSSARVMPTCAMMGQAAGTLAALAVEKEKPLRGISHTAVQDVLLKGGSVLDKEQVHFGYSKQKLYRDWLRKNPEKL